MNVRVWANFHSSSPIPSLVLCIGLSTSAFADTSPNTVLDKAYGKPNKQHGCWLAVDENDQRYCMKIDSTAKRSTITGKRLYILATGDAVDEEWKPNGSHSSPGLVGAFVLEEHNGQMQTLVSDPKIHLGSNGIGPTRWKLSLLGPSDYWGWVNILGDGNQGIFVAWHTILAPYGKKTRNIAGFPASYDDTSSCLDKPCQRLSSVMDTKLEIDTRPTDAKVYPLRITVMGTHKGKALKPRTWGLPFDMQKWKYAEPKDWPFKDVEF